MSFRDIKAKARQALHRGMKVKAKVYTGGPTGPSADVECRVNSKIAQVGDMAGTSLSYAESVETTPKLIFLIAEHTPARGNVYSIGPDEAYRVDHAEPSDTITVTAVCARLSKADALTYDPPEA